MWHFCKALCFLCCCCCIHKRHIPSHLMTVKHVATENTTYLIWNKILYHCKLKIKNIQTMQNSSVSPKSNPRHLNLQISTESMKTKHILPKEQNKILTKKWLHFSIKMNEWMNEVNHSFCVFKENLLEGRYSTYSVFWWLYILKDSWRVYPFAIWFTEWTCSNWRSLLWRYDGVVWCSLSKSCTGRRTWEGKMYLCICRQHLWVNLVHQRNTVTTRGFQPNAGCCCSPWTRTCDFTEDIDTLHFCEPTDSKLDELLSLNPPDSACRQVC